MSKKTPDIMRDIISEGKKDEQLQEAKQTERKEEILNKNPQRRRIAIYAILIIAALFALLFGLKAPYIEKAKDSYTWPEHTILDAVPRASNRIAHQSKIEKDNGDVSITIRIGKFSYGEFCSYCKELKNAGFIDPYSPMLVPSSRKDLKTNTTVYSALSNGTFSIEKLCFYATKEELSAASKGTWIVAYWYDPKYVDKNGQALDYMLQIQIANYEII